MCIINMEMLRHMTSPSTGALVVDNKAAAADTTMLHDSNSDSNNNCNNNRAARRGGRGTERFKGVVPQQNGHWGAQIYANHQRIWLGTFKSEADAAMAYDSAAIKLRPSDAHRNYPSSKMFVLETKFQGPLATDLILSMIRDGSYPSKLADFLKNQRVEVSGGLNLSGGGGGGGGFSCSLLFQKELTPSDVGKLNRLVIPKRYAVKHFPSVPETSEVERMEEVQLEFYDRRMTLWKFRYCYWKSSQSFVFTRGWNRFVKEKGLRANDTVAFYMCEGGGGRVVGGGQSSFLVIDVVPEGAAVSDGGKEGKKRNLEINDDEDDEVLGSNIANNKLKVGGGFRLFGVQID